MSIFPSLLEAELEVFATNSHMNLLGEILVLPHPLQREGY